MLSAKPASPDPDFAKVWVFRSMMCHPHPSKIPNAMITKGQVITRIPTSHRPENVWVLYDEPVCMGGRWLTHDQPHLASHPFFPSGLSWQTRFRWLEIKDLWRGCGIILDSSLLLQSNSIYNYFSSLPYISSSYYHNNININITSLHLWKRKNTNHSQDSPIPAFTLYIYKATPKPQKWHSEPVVVITQPWLAPRNQPSW